MTARQSKNLTIILMIGGLLIAGSYNCDNPTKPKNKPPVIISLTANPSKVEISGSSLLVCTASDPDGDKLTYAWETLSGSINGSGDSVTWIAPNLVGTYLVSCKVLDGNGGQDMDSVKIEVEQTIPTQGLIAYWPFNGNANDESGNGNNGTVYGATLTPDRFGNANKSYSFDGINDYIDIGNNVKPPFPVTVSAWVKLDNSLTRCIFRNDKQDNGSFRYGLTIGTSGSMIRGSYYEGFSTSSNRIDIRSNDAVLSEGVWYHIVVIFKGHLNLLIYGNSVKYDGYYDGSGSGMSYSSGNGAIGTLTDNAGPLDGEIDDIRVYNRALSETEIQALYHEGGWGN